MPTGTLDPQQLISDECSDIHFDQKVPSVIIVPKKWRGQKEYIPLELLPLFKDIKTQIPETEIKAKQLSYSEFRSVDVDFPLLVISTTVLPIVLNIIANYVYDNYIKKKARSIEPPRFRMRYIEINKTGLKALEIEGTPDEFHKELLRLLK